MIRWKTEEVAGTFRGMKGKLRLQRTMEEETENRRDGSACRKLEKKQKRD